MREINGFSEKPELVGSEDFDGWIRLAKLTDKFTRLKPILGYYWDGGGNLTSAASVLSNNLYLRQKYKADFKKIIGEELPGWMAYGLARSSLWLGEFRDARRYAWLSLKVELPHLVRFKAICIWMMSAVRFRW